jgi:choline dehydrogenase-like flavoprotein
MRVNQAEVVICGAGIAGTAAAYHLAVRRGVTDIVLIDEEGSQHERHPEAGHRFRAPHQLDVICWTQTLTAQEPDATACPQCGGRLQLIATLHDPAVIRKLLAHLARGRRHRNISCQTPTLVALEPDSRGSAALIVTRWW